MLLIEQALRDITESKKGINICEQKIETFCILIVGLALKLDQLISWISWCDYEFFAIHVRLLLLLFWQ